MKKYKSKNITQNCHKIKANAKPTTQQKNRKIIILFSMQQNRDYTKPPFQQESLQSLIPFDEEPHDIRPVEQAKPKFYERGQKSFDLYDSLISTYLISQLNGKGDIYQEEVPEIDVLVYEPPKQKKKRGRPKKQAKVEDSYSAENEEQYDLEVRLNKNKKKKRKRQVKGDSKNILPYFHRIITLYLQQLQPQQLATDPQTISQSHSPFIKTHINRHIFLQMLKDPKNKDVLHEMFRSRYLNREIMLSKLRADKKIVYLKKINLFKDVFYSDQTLGI